MGSLSKFASCAVLPITLALAGATCLAQSTEDPLGTIAQADTPTGTTTATSSTPQCNVDGGVFADGGVFEGGIQNLINAYLDGDLIAAPPTQGSLWGGYAPGYGYGYGGYAPGYNSYGYGAPGYAGWGSEWGWGSSTLGYGGLGYGGPRYGGYYSEPYYAGWGYAPPTAAPQSGCP